MERKKSRDDEINALLSALESDNDSLEELQNLDLSSDVADFLNFFNIVPGNNTISIHSLYFYYKKWSADSITQAKFNLEIQRYFPTAVVKKLKCISIKNDFLELNNEIAKVNKAKKHLKRSFYLKTHLEKFIEDLDIKEDDNWVQLKEVYKWYIKWRYKRKILKLTVGDFKKLLSFYFESKVSGSKGYFKLKGEFNMEKIKQLREKQYEKERIEEIKD